MPSWLPRPLLRGGRGMVATAVVLLAACDIPEAPLPQPLPLNIEIVATPAHGASVDPSAASRVTLGFSRSMDPQSLLLIRRVSFLLPISVDQLEGTWNEDHTRLAFDLTAFPVQPGATYEAVFTGLRTADGELYNHGSYSVLFHVRGTPDLFPLHPDSRLASREFCRRLDKSTGDCRQELRIDTIALDANSVGLETRCADCTLPERRDLFQRVQKRMVWLGYDLLDAAGTVTTRVRWPEPPTLLATPPRRGTVYETNSQVSTDGTALLDWSSTDVGNDTPVHLINASVLPTTVAFSDSRIFKVDYDLVTPDGAHEHHHERWWMYAGVGLVRRESRTERDGEGQSHLVIDAYTPPVSILSR